MNKYDLIVVGTGFASTFFLKEYLRHQKRSKVLVLEKGKILPYNWKLENKSNSDINFDSLVENKTPQKRWVQNIAFGGGSCWTGNTPRMLPADLTVRTLHNIGEDWPISYDDLNHYMEEVELMMEISGESNRFFPRTSSYPSPPHPFNQLDILLKKKYGDYYMPMPSARASQSGSRAKCCSNGVCSVCPIGAKFQIDLHMADVYSDSRVQLRVGSDVRQLEFNGDVVSSVVYERDGKIERESADLVAVGAHAIMTPTILLRSGLKDYAIGRYLSEQKSIDVRINLSKVENYSVSQRVTGYGIMFSNQSDRNIIPSCAVEGYNVPWLRADFGKWRHVGFLKLVLDDIPNPENRVTLASDGRPSLFYPQYSKYMQEGIQSIPRRVEELLKGLPVEDFEILNHEGIEKDLGGEAHIQGTVRMGVNQENSVVDPDLRHHRIRNLLCLGSGVFPTCFAANPTLPLCALSVRAARRLFQ